ncbi:BamA/TamA family outer membrane protein [Flavobacterium agrisoli]|uniref:BamA/TamA family outer membrane protein n=1 Tax=Flavobacterium agrisoli TaxID=2793066 RepID=A0A934PPI2_9FLAO|nr:BamA/TamA family outer membrane protein [Flavobacterium agrisoli]MBK0371034.1 BamA/TamA family outer membrane protein [Flavobacterium agrisoli]
MKPQVRHALYSILFCASSLAQKKEHKISFRDSLDHAIDLSDFLINAHGFVPLISPITEPAVGFGVAVAPIFIEKSKYQMTDESGKPIYSPPTLNAVVGGYTSNHSQFYGYGRMGNLMKGNLRYKFMAGYGDINMKYFPNETILKDREIELNMKQIPVYLEATYRIKKSPFYVGGSYLFRKNKVSFVNLDLPFELPPSLDPKFLDGINSGLGVVLQYDNLDNTLSPTKGTRINTHFNFYGEYLGGDFNYQGGSAFWMYMHPLGKKWFSSFRVLGQFASKEVPFYYKPFIQLRGTPTKRYQGLQTIEIETEERWNLYKRWSLIFFTGMGKAFEDNENTDNTKIVWNAGSGFRYLIARKFGLQMGLDVARGPEQFAYYIVFGYSWMRN